MMLDEIYKRKVLDVCQRLIRAKSYSGKEQEVVTVLRNVFAEFGFSDIHVDKYGSITACLKGNRPGKTILMDAHIDTVEVTDADQWKFDPFDGTTHQGRIYGRGASDMKGALAAMIVGAAMFRDQTQGDFSGTIIISGTVHEECFEGVAAKEVAGHIMPDAVIIGEATELEIAYGQRGRAEIIVETNGKQCHSSKPENGINAVYAMMDVINKMNSLENENNVHLGSSVLALTDIVSSPYPGASVIPDRCRVTYDRRTLLNETPESVLAPLQALVEGIGSIYISRDRENCYTGATIESMRFFPAWLFDKYDWHIEAAAKGLQPTGLGVSYRTYSFCTNGSYFAGHAGIPTLGFGPSRESLAHVRDEYIEVTQINGAVLGYTGILCGLLNDA